MPLGGAYRLRLADDTEVVAKRHDHASALTAEAAGLRWLAEGGFRCPRVLAHDEEWLVIEAVTTGPASTAAAEAFGRELAALHRTGASDFGCPPPDGPVDAWIGLAPMRNEPGPDWPE